MKISFCTTCMGRAHHVRRTLPVNLSHCVDWARPTAVEFVVLDYSSRDGLAEWMISEPALQPYLDAGILRFARSEGHTHFRHSHAKNMAHSLASGDVVCNLDADNFTGRGFADYLRRVFTRRPNSVVATNRLDRRLNGEAYKGSMGRVALSAANFAMLGGYDEGPRFRGWSGEDTDLLIRALRTRLRLVMIRDRRFLRVVPHSDYERIRHTDFVDAAAELAKIDSFDGYSVRPILRYVAGRAVAPRIANRGRVIGAGMVSWPGEREVRRTA
jgi:glycosyltransferase involved in cell wall biosynthesis